MRNIALFYQSTSLTLIGGILLGVITNFTMNQLTTLKKMFRWLFITVTKLMKIKNIFKMIHKYSQQFFFNIKHQFYRKNVFRKEKLNFDCNIYRKYENNDKRKNKQLQELFFLANKKYSEFVSRILNVNQ